MVSDRRYMPEIGKQINVLILVVMEYGLGQEMFDWFNVLILVVMEYGLGQNFRAHVRDLD